MQVFRYDKTFEGLLTAVFDAYYRKTFPERLLAEGEPEPMFTEHCHWVVSETDKSNRVWTALHHKLSKDICNMLMLVWLSEEDRSDELLFRYIRKVFDSPNRIEMDFSDNDILKVKQVAQRVGKEKSYLIQFLRFQKGGDGTYFAPVAPRGNILPLCINYLTDRFSDQKWLIYDTKRHYGYYYDLRRPVEITMQDDAHLLDGKLPEELLAEDEKAHQERWKSYFKAMTITERINPRLHRQMLPRRFWKYLTEKQ